MKLSDFDINILNLSNKVHQFTFTINDEFFESFEGSPVQKSQAEVILNLDKNETFFNLEFNINGTIGLVCDRSLENFDYPISIQEKVVYKFGHEDKELSEEVQIIKFGTPQINVAQYIYEFIGLAVPMKKLHPKFEEDENPFNDGEIIYSSKSEDEEQAQEEEEEIDPRWEMLKRLKDN